MAVPNAIFVQQAPRFDTAKAKTNGMAIAALVLGIVSFFLWIIAVPSVLALIFGVVGLKQINGAPETQQGKGMAIAGIVLGIISLVGGVLLLGFRFLR